MSVTSFLSKAKQLRNRGQNDEAYKLYQQVLRKYPSNQEAIKGIAALEKQNLNKAEVPLETLEKVLSLYNGKKFLDALNELENCEKNYKKNITLLNIKGAILSSEGKVSAALRCFEESTEIKPDYDEGFSNQGLALFKLNRLEEAAIAFEKSISINPKNAEAHNNIGILLQQQGQLEEAKHSFEKAIEIKETYYEAHNNLGNVLQKQNMLAEAIDSYRRTVNINPALFEGHVNIGNILKELGDISGAVVSYKTALTIDPEASHVAHLVNALSGKNTNTAPRKYISKVFDEYAGHFESHLVDELEYRIPSVMKMYFDDLNSLNVEKTKRAVDLGCGTGLVGKAFKESVDFLWGIDLSSNMLEKAKSKNIYNRLTRGDIVDELEAQEESFDLFLSADTFIYLGNLENIFKTIANKSHPNALFIFSVEHLEEGDFVLRETGRYAQSYSYIKKLAENNGFRIVKYSNERLRKDRDGWIEGGLYVLQH